MHAGGYTPDQNFVRDVLWRREKVRAAQRQRNFELRGEFLDDEGYDSDGFNRRGFNRQGFSREGSCDSESEYEIEMRLLNERCEQCRINPDGLDDEGYDRWGYDRNGYDRDGLDREFYDRTGNFYGEGCHFSCMFDVD